MEHPPADPRFLSPIVVLSATLVAITGLALTVLDFGQAWKALLALGFVGGAGAVILRTRPKQSEDGLATRSMKRTRAVFIVASIMLASQLAFAAARAGGWFGEDAERWTLQWLLVALAAAAVEVLGAGSEKKSDKSDRD